MTVMQELYGDLFGEINRLQQSLDPLFRPSAPHRSQLICPVTYPTIFRIKEQDHEQQSEWRQPGDGGRGTNQ